MSLRIKKFIYGIVAFLILVNVVFSKKEIKNKNYTNYLASFNKIDGVNVGTDVMISGIKVGQVQKVFISKNYPQIFMNVKNDLLISDDSSVSIQTDGLFGKKFILIELGGSENYMKDGDNFSFTEDSIVIEDLLEKIIEINPLTIHICCLQNF